MRPQTPGRDLRRERAEGVAAVTGLLVALVVSLLGFWLPLLAYVLWVVVA
ncbi:hypothetical protein RND64_04575 [Gordonia sp. w5E2]